MTRNLLPENFEDLVAEAVREFWKARSNSSCSRSQGGSRDAVISGQNMNGFIHLVRAVTQQAGLPGSSIHAGGHAAILPGYFRATKNWDVLIIYQNRLLAALELKSQVGSLGNNFNNRSEEVIGAAADLWTAHRESAYDPKNAVCSDPNCLSEPEDPLLNPEIQNDPRPPFLGWLMLLQDSPRARKPVKVEEPHYGVFPPFCGASYAVRYKILCERLMSRRLYSAAALVLSSQEAGSSTGAFESLSEPTSVESLFSALAASLLTAVPKDLRY